MVAGCSTGKSLPNQKAEPITESQQDRLLATCIASLNASDRNPGACANIVQTVVRIVEERGCGYTEAATYLGALLRVPRGSETFKDVTDEATAKLPASC